MRPLYACLMICIIPVAVEAAPYSKTMESSSEIGAYLDHKLACRMYLDSKYPSGSPGSKDALERRIAAFKQDLIKDKEMPDEALAGTLKQILPAMINLGMEQEAIELCKAYSARYPGGNKYTIEVHYIAGFSCQKHGKYGIAIDLYRQGLNYPRDDGFTANVRVNLGWCHYARSEYSQAEQEYKCAIESGRLDAVSAQWAWLETGRCRYFMKDYDGSIAAFKKVLSMNSGTEYARQAEANINDIERIR